jgi:predicted Zn-dependent peptidase
VESIESIGRSQVAGYWKRRYKLPTMVVSAAGRVDHRTVVRLVRKAFGSALSGVDRPAAPRTGSAVSKRAAHPVSVLNRPTEQAHLVLGGIGLPRTDERRFALAILNNALGGGMSSRLFQEIREKRGLAYSVYSFTSQYAGAGSFGVYAGVQPNKVRDAIGITEDVLAQVARDGLTDAEVARGKGQVKGGLVLGLEDAGSRMSRIGKAELVYGEVLCVDDLLAEVRAVTPDDVRELAADLLDRPRCLSVVGPFDESEFDGAV